MRAYVNFLESAGAQVVPLILSETEQDLTFKLKNLNGVLFPGGNGDYKQNAVFIQNWIIQQNQQQFYPLWGTCLGYETILQIIEPQILDTIKLQHQSRPLEFLVDYKESLMFNQFDDNEITALKTQNMTYNAHNFGVKLDKFLQSKQISDMFLATSVSYTNQNEQFIASIEGKKLPIFGTQFHPEKVIGTFWDQYDINHSWQSIKIQRKFADYFIQLARTNTNTFGTHQDLQIYLIENYKSFNTGLAFGDVYVFK